MIAKEGVPCAIVAASAATAASFLTGASWWSSLGWLSVFAVWYVFYERKTNCPPSPFALVSPISGRISRVDHCWDPWLNRESMRVTVSASRFAVGSIRSATEGRIEGFWTKAATFDGPAGGPHGTESPNCYAAHIRTDEMQDAVIAMSSRLPISRLKLDAGPGNRAGQGRRLAFAYFISDVDLLLENDALAEVKPGVKVLAGETVLARFPARRNVA